MYCSHCRAVLSGGEAVCPSCGAAVPAAAIAGASATDRLAGHIRLLAIFWYVVGALWLIPAIVLLIIGGFVGAVVPPDDPGAAIARALGPAVLDIIAIFLGAISAACFATGWGLQNFRPWARGLAIVLGVISLLHPPFGTALGIYTLWVLLASNAGAQYEQLTAASV